MNKKIDQRILTTRILVRKALMQLLQTKPIQSISVKELCNLAGINRSTFYHHYLDIYDLITTLEEEMLIEFEDALRPLWKEDCSPLTITIRTFQCIKDNADLCAITLGPYGDKLFIAKLLQIGQEKYSVEYYPYLQQATKHEVEMYFTFVSAGCIGVLENWIAKDTKMPVEQVAEMVDGIMMQGIHYIKKND